MNTQKISVSLPKTLFDFVEQYGIERHYHSRSEVITQALWLLQQAQLESSYREANREIDENFDATVEDGLEDEAW